MSLDMPCVVKYGSTLLPFTSLWFLPIFGMGWQINEVNLGFRYFDDRQYSSYGAETIWITFYPIKTVLELNKYCVFICSH